jgi:hypothetical protein
MVSLLDLAPVAENVSVRGRDIPVNGLSITDLRDLMAAFPDAAALFSGGGINAGALLASAPKLCAAGICLALGSPGTPEEIAAVLKWPAGDQVKVLNKVIALSAPDGIGPFVQMAESLLGGVESLGETANKAQGMTSQRGSRKPPVMATLPHK